MCTVIEVDSQLPIKKISSFFIDSMKNIVTVFSGRKVNIEILKKYLQKALDLKIIDEVHFWNNTRNLNDEIYLKTISNLKRTSSKKGGNYISITPELSNNCFELSVRASNDIHIKLTNKPQLPGTVYEIVLGGWNNTKSVIRKDGIEVLSLQKNGVADGNNYNNFKFVIDENENTLDVIKNDKMLMSQEIQNGFKLNSICFKTGHDCVGDLNYRATQNKGFYFMDTCEKSWKNYYNYYDDKQFENDVIMKCDDDIVFIDLQKLPNFIDFVRKNDYDLVFANTINNGVSAHFQQNKFKLIPTSLMNLEYPPNGLCGSLWENGKKAETLHKFFIENHEKFLNYDYNNEIIQIHTRYSINFFGYKGKKWHKIKDCYEDDEHNLTVKFVHTKKLKNVLYSDFYVSHLSFFKQNETGINLDELAVKYNELFHTMEKTGRFSE